MKHTSHLFVHVQMYTFQCFFYFLSPLALELRIKRENFIASELEKNHKEKSGKRKPRPADDRADLTMSGRDHANSSV